MKTWLPITLSLLLAGPATADRLWSEGALDTGLRPDTPLTFGAFSELAKKAAPAVVSIETEAALPPDSVPFFFFQPNGAHPFRRGAGSGFIIRSDGYILSNNHVVEDARNITVHMQDGRQFKAELVGRDPATDVSLLKVDVGDQRLPVAPLGNSDGLQIGEWVVAIGNPLGLSHTVTAGIVSAKGRREVRPDDRLRYPDFIQTDASINPGNSGGPLFNIRGEVVGINTAISAQGQGIGFAIPINMVKTILPALSKEGRVTRSWLGVQIQEVTGELASSFGLDRARGALVAAVVPGGPAASAGLRPGDVIVAFDGAPIEKSSDLPWLASTAGVGRAVRVDVVREGAPRELRVTLEAMPDDDAPVAGRAPDRSPSRGSSAALGITVEDLDRTTRRRMNLETGVVVSRVDPGSAAARAGLRRGDVIVQVNGEPVEAGKALVQALERTRKGQIIRLLLHRGGQQIFLAFSR